MSSSLIEEITAYRTTDGRLFEIQAEAEKHQHLLGITNSIAQLLGGKNSDICPDSDFSNGIGYFTVSQENYDKAVLLAKELLAIRDMENYSITSRAAADDVYCQPIGHMFACLAFHDGFIRRVGQAYFAIHWQELDKSIDWSIYKKES